MAYTINLTDGNVFATVADGTVNTSSSVTLVGKNYAGYGEFLDENFIQMLENFSSNSVGGNPTVAKLASPLIGQLWFDKTNTLLKMYTTGGWKVVATANSSASTPTVSVQTGDLWWDTTNQQLKIYNGSAFIVVGPAFTSTQGTTGAIPETINDSGASPHFITSLYVNNSRVAIVSKDATFTPAAPINTTFPAVFNGITLWNSGSPVFGGTATNSNLLDNLDSTDFMRATANTSTTGRLQINNDNGLFVGTANAVVISESGNDGVIAAGISTGNLVITANVGGTTFNVARALGSNGTLAISNAATVGTTLSAAGNVTGGNLVTGGFATVTGNITGGNISTAGIVTATGAIQSTANVTGGNLRTGGLITATGNITAAGNISGSFFLGNGSQLTGLSAAVSVTKIVNGTSNVEINASGGNVAFTVGATANVVVVGTSGLTTSGVVGVNSSGGAIAIQNLAGNAVGNIGSSTGYFNRVFATSTSALYSDVAERFAADEYLEPGTVVELGGTKEITRARGDLSDDVFGVISTAPAYLMNGGAGEDDTHPPVAVAGRVPVKVIGTARKGDRLVSAGDGIARVALREEITPFNVIGRCLEDKNSADLGMVNAIVTLKN
jgi:hypothetical protein